MATTARPKLGRRLRLAVAGAAVASALSVATAAASPPAPMGNGAPMGVQAPGMARSGARPNVPSGVRSQLPVFVLDKGRFTAFDAPGDGAAEFQRINNRGEIVGSYSKGPDAPLAGYLRDRRGRYTTIRMPGSVQTQAYGINNRGQVVGDYYRADGVPHGYLWDRGRFITFDGPAGTGATLTNLNDRGQLIGVYGDPTDAGTIDGFLLSRGRYTTFDLADNALTFPLGINNRGEIAGYTAARFGTTEDADAHGFVLRKGAGGPVTRIDVPGALGTGAIGIDDRGRIVGVYLNPDAAPTQQPAGTPPRGRTA